MRRILFVFLLVLPCLSKAQLILYNYHTPNAACPNQRTYYSLTNEVDGTDAQCNTYNWTVTNGVIYESGSSTHTGGSSINVIWNNNGEGGRISVVAGNCKRSEANGRTGNENIKILSLAKDTATNIIGTTSIPLYYGNTVTYETSEMFFSHDGTISNKKVNNYQWELPTGWVIVSGNGTRRITVRPDNCTGGIVRVRGMHQNECENTLYSVWSAPLTVVRPLNAPSAISGQSYIVCEDRAPRTYSVPAVQGAQSYTVQYVATNGCGESAALKYVAVREGVPGSGPGAPIPRLGDGAFSINPFYLGVKKGAKFVNLLPFTISRLYFP